MTDHSALIERLEDGCIYNVQHQWIVEPIQTDAILAEAAAALRDLTEWRDIATAPKDGTVVMGLVVDRLGSRVMAVEFNDSWYGDETRPWWAPANLDEEYGGPVNATHWLPLPSAPNQAKEAGE